MENWRDFHNSYCVEEAKLTGCTEPAGCDDEETMFWCTCISCGTIKTAHVKPGVFLEPKLAYADKESIQMIRCLTNYLILSNPLCSKERYYGSTKK